MATNLYVGRLSYDTTDDKLQALFAQYGTVVSAQVIRERSEDRDDRSLGRSKGFGFVEMEDDAAAQKAIAELDNQEFDGRTISVNVARPKEDRPRNNFGGGGNRNRSW